MLCSFEGGAALRDSRMLRRILSIASAVLVLALLPAWAAAGPTIAKAVLKDANGNGRVDAIALTYSTEINHTQQKSGTFPFAVQGYVIKSIGAATNSKKLSIKLVEGSVSDLTVTPFITYTGPASIPVRDMGGVEAQNQDFIKTVAVDPASAIHVAPTGDDGNPGTAAAPKLTVQAGIDAASAILPQPDVYVAGGTYEQVGGVSLLSGVNVDGGYMVKNGKWTRSLGATTTIVGGPQAALAERADVRLQLLTLWGLSTGEPGSSSYALRAIDGSTVTLWWVTANASDAVAGTDGDASGGDGAAGANGQAGRQTRSRFGRAERRRSEGRKRRQRRLRYGARCEGPGRVRDGRRNRWRRGRRGHVQYHLEQQRRRRWSRRAGDAGSTGHVRCGRNNHDRGSGTVVARSGRGSRRDGKPGWWRWRRRQRRGHRTRNQLRLHGLLVARVRRRRRRRRRREGRRRRQRRQRRWRFLRRLPVGCEGHRRRPFGAHGGERRSRRLGARRRPQRHGWRARRRRDGPGRRRRLQHASRRERRPGRTGRRRRFRRRWRWRGGRPEHRHLPRQQEFGRRGDGCRHRGGHGWRRRPGRTHPGIGQAGSGATGLSQRIL